MPMPQMPSLNMGNQPLPQQQGPDAEQKLLQQLAEAMVPDGSPSLTPQPGVPAVEVIDAVPPQEEFPIKMEDEEIASILEANIQRSIDWVGSEIAVQQAEAMRYYLGSAEGDLAPPEIEDRSGVVDTVVSDQIEWLMPSLMEIFFASGNPVKFNPRKPGDEDAADMMTKLCNYVVMDENSGFEVFADWFKTALISKVGVAKAWWEEDTTRTQEKYSALTDAQFAIITDDPEVTITSVTSYTDPNAERAALQQYQQAVEQYPQAQQQYQMMVAKDQQQSQQPMQQGQQPMAGGQQPPQLPPPPQPPKAPDISQLPMLHNVIVTRSKKSGRVAIAALNPEDFLISPDSVRIDDGFCAQRVRKTMSDLRAAGYKNVEDIDSDPDALNAGESSVFNARHRLEDVFSQTENDGTGDDSQRAVWLYECYLPIDCDQDGISEWRKITKSGNVILANEVCDGPPFAALCPVRIPGLFYGRSIADLAMPIQSIKTNLLRSMIDNINLQVNGRTFAIEGQVNMEDLLTNRPGGVVRVKNAAAVGPLQQGMADMTGLQGVLSYVDTMSQERTGITKYSQGLDSDTLNHTATGIENITARADLRVKLIARSFAEGGVKDLMRLIQKVLCSYQQENMVFQINGKWVDVDPRVWRNKYSMTATVGTGTGDTTRTVQHLTQLLAVQQQALQLGIATPETLYHTGAELVKALQLGEPSQFFVDPATQPPKPPQPNPQIQIAQMQLQSQEKIEQMKAQLQQQTDAAKVQAQTQQASQEAQAQAVLENQHQKLIDQRERDLAAQNQEWEREKFYVQQETARINAALAAKADPESQAAMDAQVNQQMSAEELANVAFQLGLANQNPLAGPGFSGGETVVQ